MTEYQTVKIQSPFLIPYLLLKIEGKGFFFCLEFLGFPVDQSDESIRRAGVTGDLGIRFQKSGLHAEMKCALTRGDLNRFYKKFSGCFESLQGRAFLCDDIC